MKRSDKKAIVILTAAVAALSALSLTGCAGSAREFTASVGAGIIDTVFDDDSAAHSTSAVPDSEYSFANVYEGTYSDESGRYFFSFDQNDDDGEYNCSVRYVVSPEKHIVWSFEGETDPFTGAMMTYYNGTKKEYTLMSGDVLEEKILEEDHFGTVNNIECGMVWDDNDSAHVVFPVK